MFFILFPSYGYIQDFVIASFRKGRRKDKDSPTPPLQDEYRQYLEDQFVRERITDTDFYRLVSLPEYLDYNEWLATHGKILRFC